MVLVSASHNVLRVSAVTGSGPIVEITVGALADDYADNMYPNSAYGTRPILYVGNSYDRTQNLSGPARIYIRFDLSAIPRRTHIVSAEMALYQMYAPASSQTYEVHMVESAWNESATNWKTQPASDSSVLSTARAPPEKDTSISWNVTLTVQTLLNGKAPNYAFMIRIQNERTGVANEASGFYSTEYPKEGSPFPTTTIRVNRPIQARAVWGEDRSRFVLGVAIAIGLMLVLAMLRTRAKRLQPRRSLRLGTVHRLRIGLHNRLSLQSSARGLMNRVLPDLQN